MVPPVLCSQQKLQASPGSSLLPVSAHSVHEGAEPSLEFSSQHPTSPPQHPTEAQRGTARRVVTVTSATKFPTAPGRVNQPPSPKASQGFIAGGMSDGRKPSPLPPALLKKETQEFGRRPRLEQRRPCAEACSEKQPLPCQDKRCFSTPFSGDRRCCPSAPASADTAGKG